MQTINLKIILAVLMLSVSSANAQTINWASLKKEDKHIINANIGMEHGMAYGLGYNYKINTRFFPIAAGAEFSLPAGNKILDDFKSKAGVNIRWVEYKNFQFSTRVQGVFRRYENDLVRLANFGSDMAGVMGYYRPHWFVSAEVGFDKSIVTHFKHSDLYKQIYPGAFNGWYEPSNGGNFYYGLQAGASFGRHDIHIRAGKILTQDFRTAPLMPFYGQLGYNLKF